jgi:hypothetical protein
MVKRDRVLIMQRKKKKIHHDGKSIVKIILNIVFSIYIIKRTKKTKTNYLKNNNIILGLY